MKLGHIRELRAFWRETYTNNREAIRKIGEYINIGPLFAYLLWTDFGDNIDSVRKIYWDRLEKREEQLKTTWRYNYRIGEARFVLYLFISSFSDLEVGEIRTKYRTPSSSTGRRLNVKMMIRRLKEIR